MQRFVAGLLVVGVSVGACGSSDGDVAASSTELAVLLEADGASPAVASCQAAVLAEAGVREVDDLATLDEALEGLPSADRQAMLDCAD